jgi:hypothetical protein
MLLKFDVSKAVDPTQPFALFLMSLLNLVYMPSTTDITFRLDTSDSSQKLAFALHRFVPAVHSVDFRNNLETVEGDIVVLVTLDLLFCNRQRSHGQRVNHQFRRCRLQSVLVRRQRGLMRWRTGLAVVLNPKQGDVLPKASQKHQLQGHTLKCIWVRIFLFI